MSIYSTACDLIGTERCIIWFKNNPFFKTKYEGEIYKNYYFITKDTFMDIDMWALRYINVATKSIDTIDPSPLNSKQECIELLKETVVKHLLEY